MTTIAYRNGIMASDSMASEEDYLQKVDCQKIWKIKDTLIGTAKGSYAGLVFIEWFKGKVPKDKMDWLDQGDDFETLVVDTKGTILTYNRYLVPDRHGQKEFWAIGSGAKCAMVAMECGKTAEQAVRLAIKYDLYSGGRIQTMRLDQLKK